MTWKSYNPTQYTTNSQKTNARFRVKLDWVGLVDWNIGCTPQRNTLFCLFPSRNRRDTLSVSHSQPRDKNDKVSSYNNWDARVRSRLTVTWLRSRVSIRNAKPFSSFYFLYPTLTATFRIFFQISLFFSLSPTNSQFVSALQTQFQGDPLILMFSILMSFSFHKVWIFSLFSLENFIKMFFFCCRLWVLINIKQFSFWFRIFSSWFAFIYLRSVTLTIKIDIFIGKLGFL